MVIAGLTGGIATGKSTVSGFFKELGARIIDADLIAHAVVKNGLPAWQAIIDHFGKKILLEDGEIDRVALGEIIFNDEKQKGMLNQIVHPYVFEEIATQLSHIERTAPASTVILDVPLLIESGMYKSFENTIVVYVPETIQLERLIQRDRISVAAAKARIASQMSIEGKKTIANWVIDNSENKATTKQKTVEVFGKLRVHAKITSHL